MVASRHHIAVDEEMHGKGIFVDYFVALRTIKAESLRDSSSGDEGAFNYWYQRGFNYATCYHESPPSERGSLDVDPYDSETTTTDEE